MPDYLNFKFPTGLYLYKLLIIQATPQKIKPYDCLVDDLAQHKIEITRWSAKTHAPGDDDCSDEGGTKDGILSSEWKGDFLYGRKEAVKGYRISCYGTKPVFYRSTRCCARTCVC